MKPFLNDWAKMNLSVWKIKPVLAVQSMILFVATLSIALPPYLSAGVNAFPLPPSPSKETRVGATFDWKAPKNYIYQSGEFFVWYDSSVLGWRAQRQVRGTLDSSSSSSVCKGGLLVNEVYKFDGYWKNGTQWELMAVNGTVVEKYKIDDGGPTNSSYNIRHNETHELTYSLRSSGIVSDPVSVTLESWEYFNDSETHDILARDSAGAVTEKKRITFKGSWMAKCGWKEDVRSDVSLLPPNSGILSKLDTIIFENPGYEERIIDLDKMQADGSLKLDTRRIFKNEFNKNTGVSNLLANHRFVDGKEQFLYMSAFYYMNPVWRGRILPVVSVNANLSIYAANEMLNGVPSFDPVRDIATIRKPLFNKTVEKLDYYFDRTTPKVGVSKIKKSLWPTTIVPWNLSMKYYNSQDPSRNRKLVLKWDTIKRPTGLAISPNGETMTWEVVEADLGWTKWKMGTLQDPLPENRKWDIEFIFNEIKNIPTPYKIVLIPSVLELDPLFLPY